LERQVAPASEIDTWRSQIRGWLEEQDIPSVPVSMDERFPVLRDWQVKLSSGGWLGVSWPVDGGGRGLSLMHQQVVYEELIRRHAPLPVDVVGLDVVGPTLQAWGTPKQRSERMPKILSGEEMWCQGFSEPNAGSDLAALRTRADIDGDEFVINGQKVWTSHAQHAAWCALLVRSDSGGTRHQGISYVMVPMDSEGVEVRPLPQMTGDSEFNEVFFSEVRVPVENTIGPLHEGWKVALGTLSSERSGHLIQRRVQTEVAFDDILVALRTYLGSSAEGVPALPVDAERRIGEVAVQVEMLAALSQRTTRRLANSEAPTGDDSVDKILLTEVEQAVFALAEDLLGPFRVARNGKVIGLDVDRSVHGYLYSRSMSISGGTTQIQHNIVGERVLGLPREPSGESIQRSSRKDV
jgi:alkylation response protein AidB-like acyl-CoA dehydrogenase